MTGPNPYNYNLPVGPEMFFGRQKDLDTLVRCVLGPQGDSVALIGGRRMGKTSLLEALTRELELRQYCSGFVQVPVTISIAGEGITSPEEFFRITVINMDEWLSKGVQSPSTPCSPSMFFSGPLGPAFRSYLETRNREAKDRLGCSIRLIVLMDECEKFEEQSWVPGLYEVLRWLLTQTATRGLFKVVMAGSYHFLSNARQKTSPLRNVLKPHYLRTLDTQSTCNLIVTPSALTPSDSIVAAVTRYSGGHPFLTQYLMYELWELGLSTSTAETVAHLAFRFPHERNDFPDWADTLGEPAMSAYAILTEANKALSEEQVRARLRITSPLLPQALEALCYHGLVTRDLDNGMYQVAGEMFREWFAANITQGQEQFTPLQNRNETLSAGPKVTINLRGGDVVLGDKPVSIDQREQNIQGPQTNVGGNIAGAVLSGEFHDSVNGTSNFQRDSEA